MTYKIKTKEDQPRTYNIHASANFAALRESVEGIEFDRDAKAWVVPHIHQYVERILEKPVFKYREKRAREKQNNPMAWKFEDENKNHWLGIEDTNHHGMRLFNAKDYKGYTRRDSICGYYADAYQDNVYYPAFFLLPAHGGEIRALLGFYDTNANCYIFDVEKTAVNTRLASDYVDDWAGLQRDLFMEANSIAERAAENARDSDEKAQQEFRLEEDKTELQDMRAALAVNFKARNVVKEQDVLPEATARAIIRNAIMAEVKQVRAKIAHVEKHEAQPWLYTSN